MKKIFNICLAIETSCDDTSVALVHSSGSVLGLKSQNQDDVHGPFGGVIPELACRNHTMRILPLIQELFKESKITWKEIDGVAVTSKPGLIGALLVGVTVAKTLAMLHDLPVVGVNHLEGHIHAPFLKDEGYGPPPDFDYPFVGLCVSGGHTSLYEIKKFGKYRLLGRTVDDAAGEAFDKFGKKLGLGYPAGAKVDFLSLKGDAKTFKFPRAFMKKDDLQFSFSGLKTSGHLKIAEMTSELGELSDETRANLCASYQEAIVEVLIEKLLRALNLTGLKTAVITGGVSANSRLRALAEEKLKAQGYTSVVPPLRFCTDNAAMIGMVGIKRLNLGEDDSFKLTPQAFMKIAELS
jgi:N6-L-threonylcarbamoyladenine synthase